VRLQAKRPGRGALEPQEAQDPRAVRTAALKLLARRDHGTRELERKLDDRGFEAEAIGTVLRELASQRFLDDERYIEHFVSYHAARGQGPLRISAELRQLGVDAESIERQLGAAAGWHERARAVRRKKFGTGLPKDFKGRARQARFLEYRGFSADHIRAALASDAAAEDQ
jgi:regulatory protein